MIHPYDDSSIDTSHSRLGRQSGLLPRFPPADECTGVRPSLLLKLLHRTGAGIFAGSRTVGDQPSCVREAEFLRLAGGTVGRHTYGASGLHRTCLVVLRGTNVKECYRNVLLPEVA
jgi:hypothetical protein